MNILPLVPAAPALAFLVLALFGKKMRRSLAGTIGTVPVGVSAAVSLYLGFDFIRVFPGSETFRQDLGTWFSSSTLRVSFGLYLDALSVVMLVVVTVVAFLIHLYSASYMKEDEGYSRFFAYMNLFVASMLILVLADNLVFLFLGWEGVGLCSYLLIGFWYRDKANVRAATKAFVVTRIGDAAFTVGILLLFTSLGTLDIQNLMSNALANWAPGSPIATVAALLLLVGAIGKSAQLPLQTWLPDAMAGPTPVSALLHAATMVTAGVYLIARVHDLFILSPTVQLLTSVIGAVTLIVAGASALVQRDLKRILAYSTMSQLGYMFLTLGVGAWPAAIFHLASHAFFKALLFLGAGVVILAVDDNHDVLAMGGLRKKLPLTFWTFLIACLSLSAFPLLTAGFYSKDWILYWVWSSGRTGEILWVAALAGVLLTSVYTFRMMFLIFFGPRERETRFRPGALLAAPLVILAILTVFFGFLETPRTLGDVRLFSEFLYRALPAPIPENIPISTEIVIEVVSELVAGIGIVLAWFLVRRIRATSAVRPGRPGAEPVTPRSEHEAAHAVHGGGETAPGGDADHGSLPPAPASLAGRFLYAGWGFDRLYDTLIVRPYERLSALNRGDAADVVSRVPAWGSRRLSRALSGIQTGLLRHYMLVTACGVAVLLLLAVIL